MWSRLVAVAGINLRSLPARWGAALVVVICLVGVTGVLVSMLAMARGLDKSFGAAGREDRIVVLSTGETSDSASSITRAQAPLLLQLPGLALDADGRPRAMLERYTLAPVQNARTGQEDNLILRGVGANVLQVRPEAHIVEGRMFAAGLRELVIGQALAGQFTGLSVGNEVELSGVTWRVVGVVSDGGSARESEAWGDVEVVMTAYNQSSYSAFTGMLASTDAFQALKDAVTTNPQLTHMPVREPEYFASQTSTISTAMRVLGYIVAAIMALGTLFATIDTMYASVEARSVEIATLRAIGFDELPIVISVLVESIVLCVIGALIGGCIAWAVFNGYTASTMNGFSQTRVAFTFSVDAGLLVQAVLVACAVGFLGGLWPAIRAARVPIIEALRET
jgi:putative ABC transport system permease protein